jgi:hypothetical protein
MKSDMEDRKWLDDYMSLKQINPNNPFTVPEGYFDEFENRVTSYIHLDELRPADAENFTVPENYFDELSSNIQSRINIEVENTGFDIPENYFDTLQEHINARIAVEEVLEETDKHFTVPANYFERLNQDILNKTVNLQTTQRRGIVRKMFATGAFKYAAAACFALVIGTGVYIRQITDPVYIHNNSFLHKQIATIPVSDIKSYLQDNVDPNDVQHTVIAEGTPVDDANLSNDLQDYIDTNN